jgi:tryptophanyl-tRNA synthetase
MGLLNPYTYIAGGVITAAIGGAIFFQSTQIHHYHMLYNTEHDTNVQLIQKIHDMTETQNNQTKLSDQNIIKIIDGRKQTAPIIAKLQAAPVDPNACILPDYPQEIKDAF